METPQETPKVDLMNSALEHYEKAATAAHHWNSDIPKAIVQYYAYDHKLNKTGWFSCGLIAGMAIMFMLLLITNLI